MIGSVISAASAAADRQPVPVSPMRWTRDLIHLVRRRRIDVVPVPARHMAGDYRSSPSGGPYRRKDPGEITGSARMLAMIADARAREPVAMPPTGVARFRDAIVCGEGVICRRTPNGPVIVQETLHNALEARSLGPIERDADGLMFVRRPLRPRRRLRGTYVNLRQIWDANYGHWLVEGLPRLAVLADHHDLADLRFLVSKGSRDMRRIVEESMAAFGIRPEQIVAMGRETIEVEDLLYPLPMTIHPWIKAPRVARELEHLGRRICGHAAGPKRLYVSRAGARHRHLLNEADVLRVADRHGFWVLQQPERLSFADQVRMFSGAEIIVGNYGANLTNMVFAPPGVTLFALTSEAMPDDFFWDLTSHKGGRYVSLHGTAACADPDLDADFRIDIARFEATLRGLL